MWERKSGGYKWEAGPRKSKQEAKLPQDSPEVSSVVDSHVCTTEPVRSVGRVGLGSPPNAGTNSQSPARVQGRKLARASGQASGTIRTRSGGCRNGGLGQGQGWESPKGSGEHRSGPGWLIVSCRTADVSRASCSTSPALLAGPGTRPMGGRPGAHRQDTRVKTDTQTCSSWAVL